MRRIFSALFLSLFFCLVFLAGIKSDVHAVTICAPKSVSDSYVCDLDIYTMQSDCSGPADPNASNYCCGIVNQSQSACDAYCFLPGTLVKSSTGSRKIEDIKVGDRVTSFVDNKITESSVSQIFERKRDFYYSLIAGDYSVKASAEHPFYVGDNKYTKISELKKGDTVYVLKDNKLEQKTVTSNTKIVESTPVYNMTVDNTNTYFANGFAVHNKECTGCGCGCLCGRDGCEDGNRAFCWDHDHDPNNWDSCLCAHPHNDPSGLCLYGEHPVDENRGYNCTTCTADAPASWQFRLPGPNNICFSNCVGPGDECVEVIRYTTCDKVCAPVPNFVDLYCPKVTPTPTPIPPTPTCVPSTTTTTCSSLCGPGVITTTNNCTGVSFDTPCLINDPTVWGTPTTCSVQCGGGTQNKTNQCGTTVAQACNLQACEPWIKLKDSSFVSPRTLTNLMPLLPTAYDADDTTEQYFVVGKSGVALAPAISLDISNITLTAKTGNPEYKALYTPKAFSITPALFLSYVKARKEYKVITNLDQISGSGIYVYNGSISISSDINPFNQAYKIVLIATGTVTIDSAPGNKFSPAWTVVIVAPTINFGSSLTEATGIFIGNTISTGTNATQGLKIIGNLVAETTLSNGRAWATTARPSALSKT